MYSLTIAFIKIFYRNRRTMFFVILLPLGIYIAAAVLGLKDILRFNKTISYNDFLLTGVMAFAIMQTGIYTVAYTFIDYHRSRSLKRMAVTPLSSLDLLSSHVLARYIIALLQIATLVLCGMLIFGTKVSILAVLLPIIIFAGNILFLNIGFIIASMTRDYEQAAPYTMVVGTILMFLGDAFFPIENVPAVLARIADFLPMKPFVSLIRYSMFGLAPQNVLQEIVVLAVWLVVLTVLAKDVFEKKAYR